MLIEAINRMDVSQNHGAAGTKPELPANMDWSELLGRSTATEGFAIDTNCCENRTVLITGAGGSIGSALAMRIAGMRPRSLVLLDSSEHSLFMLGTQLRAACPCPQAALVVGNVADPHMIGAIFDRYGPELVIHAAAYKHVSLMESNPFAAVQNNALGTYRLAQTMRSFGAGQLFMVSTDKAVNPASIMGASKRIAEMVLQTDGNAKTRMNSLRLGNVLGSQGSVVPLFLERLSQNVPVNVTDPEAQRFFFTIQETTALILQGMSLNLQNGILVPASRKPVSILDLAKFLIARCGASSGNPQITFSGLRPGEKLVEEFVAPGEELQETICTRLMMIENADVAPRDELHGTMTDLDRSLQNRDLPGLLRIVRELVPRYIPSATVLSSEAAVGVRLA